MNTPIRTSDYYHDREQLHLVFLHGLDHVEGLERLSLVLRMLDCDDVQEEFDGIWFVKIKMSGRGGEYYLYWHEDIGIYAYCENQDKHQEFKEKIDKAVKFLNDQ